MVDKGTLDTHFEVSKWHKNHPFFWKQMLIGARSYILNPSKNETQLSVEQFFQEHYTLPDPYVFDGQTYHYMSQISYLRSFSNIHSNVIDLGCGQASLYHYLTNSIEKDFVYTGIDFAMPNKIIGKNASIRHCNLSDIESVKYLKNENSIFAINSICYIDDLNSIPILKPKSNFKNEELLIVEPWPGIFWDRHFNGIWPSYRTPDRLILELSNIGWMPTQQIIFFFIKLFGHYLLPLSYAMSFKLR